MDGLLLKTLMIVQKISPTVDAGEAEAIMLARSRQCPVLIDDLAARMFATGLGLEVTGSIGVVVRAVKVGLISRDEGLDALDKLARGWVCHRNV